ncbi:MAG: hypothetical protein ACTHQ3_16000 [Motilibacteraceae bacterium]
MALTTTPGRPAVVHANYPGDITSAIGQIVGPNTIGERLMLVEVDYDEAADRSLAGFSYVLGEVTK